MRWRGLAVALCWGGVVVAQTGVQTAAPKVEDSGSYGTVIGHVLLPGSNLPARFASVALQPVDMQPQVGKGTGDAAKMPVSVVQTGLDGSYKLEHVGPGNYYVVVNLPGYLSPIAQFTVAQLKNPTAEEQKKIQDTVPTVDVRPNSVATADIRLERGGSIGGVVRFDDGSPSVMGTLNLMVHNEKGAWETLQNGRSLKIDEDGRFRMSGLAAGEYRLQLTLSFEEKRQSAAVGWVTNSSSSTKNSMLFFSGDTTVQSDAKSLTLKEGEAITDADLTIPVSKLHMVTGAVVDGSTGQALNSGFVSLVNQDHKVVASSSIDAETRTFTFAFAPEGEYSLSCIGAQEVVVEPAAAGSGLPARNRQKTLRSYGGGELPVIIHGDMSGLTVPVSEKAAGAK